MGHARIEAAEELLKLRFNPGAVQGSALSVQNLFNVGNVCATEKHQREDDQRFGVPNLNRLLTQFDDSTSITGCRVKRNRWQKDVDADATILNAAEAMLLQ